MQETIKQLQEEVACIEEAQSVFSTFSDWLSMAQNNFSTVAISVDAVDRFAMDRKMKKLEVQHFFMPLQHRLTLVLVSNADMSLVVRCVPSRPFRQTWSRVTPT